MQEIFVYLLYVSGSKTIKMSVGGGEDLYKHSTGGIRV